MKGRTDQFVQVCDLAQGWHAAARERALSIHLINQYQVGHVDSRR